MISLTEVQLDERRKHKMVVMLDASAFKESACKLRLFNISVLGLREKMPANDIVFGTAAHKFKAIFRQKGQNGIEEGLLAAHKIWQETDFIVKTNKTYLGIPYLTMLCLDYADRYSKDPFQTIRNTATGEALIELKFAPHHLIYSTDLLDIVLTGTIDEIGKWLPTWNGGMYCIADLKTTSARDPKDYFKSYRLSTQLKFYRWIFREYAIEFPDSIFGEINRSNLGCFIDGAFLQGKDKPINFQRSEIFTFDDKDMDEFGRLVSMAIKDFVPEVESYIKDGTLPIRYGMLNGACDGGRFGHCKFFDSCAESDPQIRQVLLDRGFKKQVYNPLLFN